jgi:2-phospho-L-lactate guanylyltransferase (CobY/MobA/RfbA family)
VVTTVVPYRGDAKRRLPPAIRAAAAVAMLGDVVAAARRVGPVLVVTDDVSVAPPGAEAVLDPGSGLGAAVAAGLDLVDGHALVLNADLPCATPAAIRTLASAGLALVEAADGTTNALSLPDPSLFAPLYGPASAARFRAHAGARGRRRHVGRPPTARPSDRPADAGAPRGSGVSSAGLRIALLPPFDGRGIDGL